jgi:2-polyprenyl-3-methyl-5-hydroxy-6-metoxy-1,4-benzoquinol methylase
VAGLTALAGADTGAATVAAPRATHLPGGNFFDDVRVDVDASVREQEAWLAGNPRRPVPRGTALSNRARLFEFRLLKRLGRWDAAVNGGVRAGWFEEFQRYWHGCLGGRPIDLWDFRPLLFHYRRRYQSPDALSWSSSDQHIRNWQDPRNLFQVFQAVARGAVHPVRSWSLPRLLRPGMRILEYGCGTAPMYRTWRRFFAHVPTRWALADIPNFPFHFARHALGADAGVDFVCITPERFADPLQGVEGPFDLIIVQEVFEHLDRPRQLAEYLVGRLAAGGLLFFDYIESGGTGLDTPAGVEQRRETLRYLHQSLELVEGAFASADELRGAAVGRKRPGRGPAGG